MEVIHVIPDTPMSVLTLFSTSKTSIDVMSDSIIQEVKEGRADALAVRAMLKAMEMVIDRVNKETQAEQLTAAEKYPERKFTHSGVEFEKKELGVSYDYSQDQEWQWLANVEKENAEQRKTREAFLKTLTAPMNQVTDDGEFILLTPPKKSFKAGLAVSIK